MSWSCWYAAAALSEGDPATSPGRAALRVIVFHIGVFAPGIVAIAITAITRGRDGLRALLTPLFRSAVPWRWYAFAIGYMAAVKLTVALLHRIITGAWPRFGVEPWYLILAATVFSLVIGGQAGEEIGWRGWALSRLAARFGLGSAAVILGVVWAAWHLPLFWLPFGNTQGQSFPLYLSQVTAISVAFAWLYAKTGGSLLLTMLLHSAVNQSLGIVPSGAPGASQPWTLSASLAGWLTAAVLWVVAAVLLARMPRLVPDAGVRSKMSA
ncbi:MAG TPA: CPBP family intramembrane glutamic endopeptidase [Candidatus Eisenbacteria bacterium]|nr:CPBP family intramembrane glutamic endopeptidase [Candidatus Eisenbacteria bacterium]